jgi:hypothetical protein
MEDLLPVALLEHWYALQAEGCKYLENTPNSAADATFAIL